MPGRGLMDFTDTEGVPMKNHMIYIGTAKQLVYKHAAGEPELPGLVLAEVLEDADEGDNSTFSIKDPDDPDNQFFYNVYVSSYINKNSFEWIITDSLFKIFFRIFSHPFVN